MSKQLTSYNTACSILILCKIQKSQTKIRILILFLFCFEGGVVKPETEIT